MKVVATSFLPLWLLVSETFPATTNASTIPDSPTEAPAVVWDRELEAPVTDPVMIPTESPVVPTPVFVPNFVTPFETPFLLPDTQAPMMPTELPTMAYTQAPMMPTESPTKAPTERPTKAPTESPTKAPTEQPTKAPTKTPTKAPTKTPTLAPVTAAPQRKTRKPNKKSNIKKPKPNSKG